MSAPPAGSSPRASPPPFARALSVRMLTGAIGAYQIAVSPLLAPSCRYWPSCSAYAIEALRAHGASRGTWLAVRRLCRCHPWARGGVDPVPPAPDGGFRHPNIESTHPDIRTP